MLDLEAAGRRLSLAEVAPTPPVSKLEMMRAQRARRRRTAVAASAATVVAVVAALAGWISSDTTPRARVTTSPRSGPSRSALAMVKGAVAATKTAGTAEFDQSITSSQPETSVASIGSVDFATRSWMMTEYQGTPGPSTETSYVRVIGPTTYVRPIQANLPRGGNFQWMKAKQQADPFVWVFAPLSNPNLTASYAGTSIVHGTPTYVYDAYIPAGTVDGRHLPSYEIQVSLDSQGRIREATTTRPSGGMSSTTTQTLLLSHFGVPVTVAVPSPVASTP